MVSSSYMHLCMCECYDLMYHQHAELSAAKKLSSDQGRSTGLASYLQWIHADMALCLERHTVHCVHVAYHLALLSLYIRPLR